MLKQLSGMLDKLPVAVQILIAIGLIGYSFIAIYGRINLAFGAKAFGNIPPEEIRTNFGHILQYTVIPVIVTIGSISCQLLKTRS